MSTEQKTKETVCTSDDAMVVVTTKVEVNKDQCCGGGNQTGDFVTQEELRKYQKFIRLHGGKGIYYNYQLSDGVTFNELGYVSSGNTDRILEIYIEVFNENNSTKERYNIDSTINFDQKNPNIERFVNKNIKCYVDYNGLKS
ncbi:hypothetical protein [Myroides odoratimimus]|uniref:hypothetical protein n=1 Tax=Myroides odoratimimus TaxID=76832 RepID=UPI00046975E3|nr:hypothetical protein [Myroides odoratimimus]